MSINSWEPIKEAHGTWVVVGAKRRLNAWDDETVALAKIPPKQRSVEKAWRKAEKWCERANRALEAAEDET